MVLRAAQFFVFVTYQMYDISRVQKKIFCFIFSKRSITLFLISIGTNLTLYSKNLAILGLEYSKFNQRKGLTGSLECNAAIIGHNFYVNLYNPCGMEVVL